MLESLRYIKNRIRSIENIYRVTNAMQMISAVKLKRVNKALYSQRRYYANLENILTNLFNCREEVISPYFQKRNGMENQVLCLITSDNGLCGLYNHNLLRLAEDFISRNDGKKINLILVGKKGVNYFKPRGLNILHSYIGLNGRYDTKLCDKLSSLLINLFLSQQVGEIHIGYTYFKNSVTQNAVIEKFLGIEIQQGKGADYILEQDFAVLLGRLAFQCLLAKMRLVFLQAFTSEHAARNLSMKTATDNAKEILDGLILTRNKTRQAMITQEIEEIVSSAEALRG